MLKRRLCTMLIRREYGSCHIEWVAPDAAVVTTNASRRYLLTYHRFCWMELAQFLVPATICLWSLVVVSGVLLGCFYGKIL